MPGLPPPQRPLSPREAALLAPIQALADEPATSPAAWVDKIEGLRGLAIDVAALWEKALCDACLPDATDDGRVTWTELTTGLGIIFPTLQARQRNRPAQRLAAEPRTPRQVEYRRYVPGAYATRRERIRAAAAADAATSTKTAAASAAAVPLSEPIAVLPTPPPAAGNPPPPASITFGPDQMRRLDHAAAARGVTRNALIVEAVRDLVSAHALDRVPPIAVIPSAPGGAQRTWIPEPGMVPALEAFAAQWGLPRTGVLRIAVELLLEQLGS